MKKLVRMLVVGLLVVMSLLSTVPVFAAGLSKGGGASDNLTVVPVNLQPKDAATLGALTKAKIDKNYVKLTKDYGLKSQGASPYAQTFTDLKSGTQFASISQLPMVDSSGNKIVVGWTNNKGIFTSKDNTFTASISGNTVFISSPSMKANQTLTYSPDLYIGGVLQARAPSVLQTKDYFNNSNYSYNCVTQTFPFGVRLYRLIEGEFQGYWVFTSDPKADVKIVYNQNTPLLHLSMYANSPDTETIPRSAFVNPFGGYPFTITDSMVFHPDADPESTSVDGYVGITSGELSWNDIWTSDGNVVSDSATAISLYYIQATTHSYPTPDTWYDLYRSIFLFDTSGLPDTATITSATLSLFGAGFLSPKHSYGGCTPSISVCSSSPASNTALITADYKYTNFGTTAYSNNISYGDYDDSHYNDFNFNSTGIGAISLTGVTKLGARSNYDITNTEPPWSFGTGAYVNCLSSEYGIGFAPTLTVIYTLSGPTIATNNATSITETSANLSANITAINDSFINQRGFKWGTSTGVYTSNWTESSVFGWGTGVYGHTALLTAGTLYFYKAYATNNASATFGFGSEETFLTLPYQPTVFTAIGGDHSIALDWIKGVSSNRTMIRYRTDGIYPTDPANGTLVYLDVGTNYNLSASPGVTYKIAAWGEVSAGIWQQFSSLSATTSCTPFSNYLVLYIDGVDVSDTILPIGVTVASSSSNLTFMSSATPWASYLSLSINGTERLHYQPVGIIGDESYSDGTVSGTVGTTTLTGAGTIWTTNMTFDLVSISGDSTLYTITKVPSSTTAIVSPNLATSPAFSSYNFYSAIRNTASPNLYPALISWGSNPSNISTSIGPMVVPSTTPAVAAQLPIPAVVKNITGNSGPESVPVTSNFPLYGIFDMAGNLLHVPTLIMINIGAIFLIVSFGIMCIVSRLGPLFTGGIMIIIGVVLLEMHIFDYWMVFMLVSFIILSWMLPKQTAVL